MNSKLVESLHQNIQLKKGELFLELGKRCSRIGMVQSGVLRGYVTDDEGQEITTHFYQENDMIFGNFIPNVASSLNVQAIVASNISTADFNEVMSYINKNQEITEIINRAFHQLNTRQQSRLIALTNLNSVEKYELFLNEYPNLINRVPHYYIANFLGITPTQLSRARKQFSQQM